MTLVHSIRDLWIIISRYTNYLVQLKVIAFYCMTVEFESTYTDIPVRGRSHFSIFSPFGTISVAICLAQANSISNANLEH